jgi:carbonic anhydrase/acetyltransferase-like protein (isoleucine patch superfamily)
MLINHARLTPTIHPSAYVAPTAVVSGEVEVGPGARILFGAVLSSEGGPIEVGPGCVIMEHAVLRGTARHPTRLGLEVLVGPHAYVSGAHIGDHVFVATGAMVFNGAVLGPAALTTVPRVKRRRPLPGSRRARRRGERAWERGC